MIDVSVTSVFNKKTKTDEFYCYGHNREDTSIDLVSKLIKYCGNLADKLKK